MTPSSPASWLVPIAVTALIVWRFYRRVRRTIGRQKFSNVRPWITITVFPLLCAFLATATLTHPVRALALAGGVLVGVGLGIYGLRVTRYEQTPEGLFYIPSAHLGIALSGIFLARIVFRMIQLYAMPGGVPDPSGAYTQSPLTLLIFGMLAGYYVTYAIGLLRWKRSAGRPFNRSADEAAA